MNIFDKLFSALILYSHNTKMLHWGVTGVDFNPTHELMGTYYEQLDSFIDDIAEIRLMIGMTTMSLKDSLKVLEDSDQSFLEILSGESFTSKECFEKIEYMFNDLVSIYNAARLEVGLSSAIANKLDEHKFWIEKELLYKNKRRLS